MIQSIYHKILIYGFDMRSIYRRMDTNKYYVFSVTPFEMPAYFIFKDLYPENFISLYTEFNKGVFSSKTLFGEFLIKCAIVRRYMLPTITPGHLLLNIWSDNKNYTVNAKNGTDIVHTADECKFIAELVMQGDLDTMLSLYNIDLQLMKDNTKLLYPRFYIHPHLTGNTKNEIKKNAIMYYFLMNYDTQSDYRKQNVLTTSEIETAKKIVKQIKGKGMSLLKFCEILPYYTTSVKINHLSENTGISKSHLRTFRRIYDSIDFTGINLRIPERDLSIFKYL